MNPEPKKWLAIVCFIIGVIVLNANLPENNVAKNLDLSGLKDENILSNFFGGTLMKTMTTDVVADWKYRNFLVLKVAESDRLKLIAIGFPFCRWSVYSTESNQ